MNPLRMLGILFIVAGALGLLYGSFSYTSDRHEANIGPIALSVSEKKTVNIPLWAGLGAIALGTVLLVIKR